MKILSDYELNDSKIVNHLNKAVANALEQIVGNLSFFLTENDSGEYPVEVNWVLYGEIGLHKAITDKLALTKLPNPASRFINPRFVDNGGYNPFNFPPPSFMGFDGRTVTNHNTESMNPGNFNNPKPPIPSLHNFNSPLNFNSDFNKLATTYMSGCLPVLDLTKPEYVKLAKILHQIDEESVFIVLKRTVSYYILIQLNKEGLLITEADIRACFVITKQENSQNDNYHRYKTLDEMCLYIYSSKGTILNSEIEGVVHYKQGLTNE